MKYILAVLAIGLSLLAQPPQIPPGQARKGLDVDRTIDLLLDDDLLLPATLSLPEGRYRFVIHNAFTSARLDLTPDAPFADQNPNDPQSWNLFGYVRNNPLSHTDPTGRCLLSPDVSCFDFFLGAAKEVANVVPAAATLVNRTINAAIGTNLPDAPRLQPASNSQAEGMASAGITLLLTPLAEAVAVRPVATATSATAVGRASEIHGTLNAGTASRTTTAVTETSEGVRVVSSSELRLRPAQRAALRAGEVEGTGPGHAEITGINAAESMGLTPTGTAASRPICTNCAQTMQQRGIAPLSPLKK